MPADVLEHPDFIAIATHHQQRLAKEADRVGISPLRDVADETGAGPRRCEQHPLFGFVHFRIGIERIGKAARRFNGLHYR